MPVVSDATLLEALLAQLNAVGLNLHGVLRIGELPPAVHTVVHEAAPDMASRGVLWVVGHQGPQMWRHLRAEWGADWPQRAKAAHPIDDWARETVTQALHARGIAHRCLFPAAQEDAALLPLQQLGAALGWHHHSPFQVGIDAEWGSWFAYRAVCVVDAAWAASVPRQTPHPCETCASRACEAACPADALRPQWRLQACMAQRLAPASSCAQSCQARVACPVGAPHAYDDAQLAYHYGQSLAFIRQLSSGDSR